ncbi:hypothetical protein LBMAG56_42310 [Verrucomicrobiota bacterium]|nr:hypothetical protein LBMAG56_42310 [Verrucomicrobiota bacterium]
MLEVHDDGVSKVASDQHAPRSLGLTGMREHAARCGGTVMFVPNEPRDTRVVARVPGKIGGRRVTRVQGAASLVRRPRHP